MALKLWTTARRVKGGGVTRAIVVFKILGTPRLG
jgi:hypothetical protein